MILHDSSSATADEVGSETGPIAEQVMSSSEARSNIDDSNTTLQHGIHQVSMDDVFEVAMTLSRLGGGGGGRNAGSIPRIR